MCVLKFKLSQNFLVFPIFLEMLHLPDRFPMPKILISFHTFQYFCSLVSVDTAVCFDSSLPGTIATVIQKMLDTVVPQLANLIHSPKK